MRWRSVKRCRPPRGKQLLIYDPALSGRRDVLDDGTRLGYFDGLRLRAADERSGEYLHWLPYTPPPRLARAPNVALTSEMRLVIERLRIAHRRGELVSGSVIEPEQHDAKVSTLHALARRGLLEVTAGQCRLPVD